MRSQSELILHVRICEDNATQSAKQLALIHVSDHWNDLDCVCLVVKWLNRCGFDQGCSP